MNRKQRRELRRDKNLIIELYSIIKKYLPNLLDKFEKLTDVRHQSYITYNMKTICVTRIIWFDLWINFTRVLQRCRFLILIKAF